MYKQICLIIFVSISIDQIAGESPCGDWLSFRDEKCFKVIDSLTIEAEVGSICQKQLGATFGIIRSAEEQDLVYDYLKKKNFADNVWIGLKKVNNSFKALDGSISNYSNWNTGRPTNQSGFDCVEIAVDYQGKWADVKCEKKNAMLCEKKQEWSNSKIETILQELRKMYTDQFTSIEKFMRESETKFKDKIQTQKIEIQNQRKESHSLKTEIDHLKQSTDYKLTSLENKIESQKNESQSLKYEIDHLKQNPVPIGFIYLQLSGQSDPQTLWPNTQWDNVSKNYGGLFFRAEGGGSNVFGQIQEQQTQSIEFQNEKCGKGCKTTISGADNFIGNSITITNEYSLTGLWTGGGWGDPQGVGLKFKHNSEEIRPRNQAIRIWIRIK